ncbi:hypothetical protein P3T27_003960 [Kitasatospora sp. MAA19]|uniref:DUF6300 family protein n=1 Tax=Kitasatospora sp. MAA19 TaxID=3035090 RepID=UPI00247710F8|nr:DUF6300 family protein [Kitasatospora sp. MAA19]MDH6707223.1 hypothetical protein [Kitasatospora sp. MAA19]
MTEEAPTTVAFELVSDDELCIAIADVPACPACGTSGLLLVRYQHSWKNQSGDDVVGIRETLLCPQCAAGNRAAAELIAFFAVEERASPENVDVFGEMVAAWVESLRRAHVDEELLTAEYDRWLRGVL